MIAKTTIGSSFSGALNYGAGLKPDGQEIIGKSELLHTENVVSKDSKGMSEEMEAVADGHRCKNAVWHTSLSWKEGESINPEQMKEASLKYCDKMGASPENHQIVIFLHKNTPHPHVHIYINRVPMDGGKALDRGHNYARNERICKEITKEMQFDKLPEQRLSSSIKDNTPMGDAKATVQQAIKEALTKDKISNFNDLSKRLREQGIESIFKPDSNNNIVGASFKVSGIALKGQDVGYKAKDLREELTKNKSIAKVEVMNSRETGIYVRNSIRETIEKHNPKSLEELSNSLKSKGIESNFVHSKSTNELLRASFKVNDEVIEGNHIGYDTKKITEIINLQKGIEAEKSKSKGYGM
jgi:hypothetical protein